MLAIVSGLLTSSTLEAKGKDTESIKETAGKLCKFALSIGNDVVQKFTGVDVFKAGQYAEPKDTATSPELGQVCFQLYRERQEVFDELKSLLRKLASESDKTIVVIVDELDRCRPTYAVEFLEVIKHFFDIQGLVFVLGVDKRQLTSSVKVLFGHDLDFDEYYRKFAHRNVTLPVKLQDMTKRFCQQLVNEYFCDDAFRKKKRFSFITHDQHREDNVVELCTVFSLNARQIHELFRITSHILSANDERKNRLLWGLHIGAFFMTALSMKNSDLYHRIGQELISPKEFTEYLKNLDLFKGDERDGFWWAALLYLGAFKGESFDVLQHEFRVLGVCDQQEINDVAFKNELARFSGAYSRGGRGSKSSFARIYDTLEGLRTFAAR